MPFKLFKKVQRPRPRPNPSLDDELAKSAEDASLTLYFVNMAVVRASGLHNSDAFGKSDPWCQVTVGEISDKTPVINNDLNPVWNEKMAFFVPSRPSKLIIQIYDSDDNDNNDLLGTAEFPFNDMFETEGKFAGNLPLQREAKFGSRQLEAGTVEINLACRMMRPIQTEIKLSHTENLLESKTEEHTETVVALDESEQLREEAIGELSEAEQKIIRQAEELALKAKEHHGQLSEKEQQIVDQAALIEQKIKEIEETKIALRETELQKLQAESKLTEAEEEIMAKARELETKQREHSEELTSKEKEILEQSEALEEKDREHKEVELKLRRTEALREEVANELTAKEQIILEQAHELETKAREHADQLTSKEKEILAQQEALEAKDRAAELAQLQQDELSAEVHSLQTELTHKEEELLAKAEELKQKQAEHKEALSTKELEILHKAEQLEEKKLEHEEAMSEVKEKNLEINSLNTRLTEAEERIVQQAQELETKAREHADELTSKEQEILAKAHALEAKSQAHDAVEEKLHSAMEDLENKHKEFEAVHQLAELHKTEGERLSKELAASRARERHLRSSLEEIKAGASSLFEVKIMVMDGKNLRDCDLIGHSDPFLALALDTNPADDQETKIVQNSNNPVWNQSLIFLTHRSPSKVQVTAWDDDGKRGKEKIGDGEVDIASLVTSQARDHDVAVPLTFKRKNAGTVNLSITVTQCKSVPQAIIAHLDQLLSGGEHHH